MLGSEEGCEAAERLLNKQDEGLFRKSTQLRAFTLENILKLVGHTSLPPWEGTPI